MLKVTFAKGVSAALIPFSFTALLATVIGWHLNFVFKTSGTDFDVSYIIDRKSVYSYAMMYTINVIIIYTVLLALKYASSFIIGSKIFFALDAALLIGGLALVCAIALARGAPLS